MLKRISLYEMHNDKESAWNTFSNEIKALNNDIYIMCHNPNTVGEIPEDIKKSLLSLANEIYYQVDRKN